MPTETKTQSVATRITTVNGKLTDIVCNIVFNTYPHPELSIQYDGQPDAHRQIPVSKNSTSTIGHIRLANGIETRVLALPPYGSPFKLIPVAQPISVVHEGNIGHVHFKVLNGPGLMQNHLQFYGQQDYFVEIGDQMLPRGGQILEAPPWTIHLVEEIHEAPSLVQKDAEYIITHQGCLERGDATPFSQSDANTVLEVLRLLFSFVKGASCAISSVRGETREGGLVWERFGSHHAAPKAHYSSILPHHVHPREAYDARTGAVLQALFPGIWSRRQSQRWPLLQKAIMWYLRSNETSASLVSIVLNQIALERLADFVECEEIAPNRLTPTKDNIGQALEWANVDLKNEMGCHELAGAWRTYKKSNVLHALIDIRNDLTHANEGMKLSDPVLHEAAFMGKWYIEMLLLRVLDYKGIYMNRLTFNEEYVPWV